MPCGKSLWKEYKKERKEHPSLKPNQVWRIVYDHSRKGRKAKRR